MDTKDTVQNYIVQPVMLPVLPTSAPYLADPTAIDPAYNAATQQLIVAMTFMLPSDVSSNDVSVKQFYSPAQSSKLQFYVTYSSESTATPKPVECWFKAIPTDAAGNPIDLGAILRIFSLVVNTVGPKSSRGIMSTVRTTED